MKTKRKNIRLQSVKQPEHIFKHLNTVETERDKKSLRKSEMRDGLKKKAPRDKGMVRSTLRGERQEYRAFLPSRDAACRKSQ